MITRLIAFARGLLRRRAIDDEITEEIRDHIERATQAHVAHGMPLDEARAQAIRDLGGLTQTIESTREVRATWFDGIGRDVRYAARVLQRSPIFTTTALALLTLGIGATTAILSVAYAVLIRPLPHANPDRLVFITEQAGNGIAWPNFEDWKSRAKSFDGLAGSLSDGVIKASDDGLRRRLDSRSVTANFFRVLGTTPLRGRLFVDADAQPDATPTVVVSYDYWMRELGGNDAALGRSISLNGKSFLTIGVLPPDFRYMTRAELFLLLEPQVAADYRGMKSRGSHTTFYAVGRLRPGVSVEAARAELTTIQGALALEYSTVRMQGGIELVTLADRVTGKMAPSVAVLAGAVTLLLLITCANLASLLLNRGASRAHELRIRAAIGGSRWQLIRQLLVEHGMLILAGAVLGAVAGALMLRGLVAVAPRDFPRLDEVRLDVALMFGITALSGACAFVFGVVPLLETTGATGQGLTTRSGRGATRARSRLRSGLMVGEIALATVLLSGAGLMIQTMVRLTRVDLGFDPHNVQAVSFSLSGPSWPDERKQAFYQTAVERLRAIPGVRDAAVTYLLPMNGSNWWNAFMVAGTSADHWTAVGEFPNAGMVPVTSGYFELLRIPLIKGRYFDASETPTSAPTAIINSSLARRYWPNENPIGKQVRQGYPEPYGPWRTIVGVVGDIKQHGVDQENPREIFLPIVQQPRSTVFAIVRTDKPVPSSAIESAIRDLDRTIPVFNDRTIEQVIREATSLRRIVLVVLSVFGGVALLLAAIGLYGIVAQGVADRRQEIGVRVALGATSHQVVGMFLRSGIIVIGVGIPAGFVAAIIAARQLQSLVFGIAVTDRATLGAVAVVLVAITLIASYLPARSAARVDPLNALRAE